MRRLKSEIPDCVNCLNKGNSIICSLSTDSKSTLTKGKGENFFKKGQVIFYEGNHVNGLFCVFDGKVKLSKMGESGKEQIVRFAKTGDILGYRSLLSNDSYKATATAMEDSWVCVISKEQFNKAMVNDSNLAVSILRLLSNDLKNAEHQLVNLSQKSVLERMSEAIILLDNNFGREEDGLTLNVNLTRSELADIAGTTTETAIRTLAQLKEEGTIDLGEKKIRIIDLKNLIRIAGLQD